MKNIRKDPEPEELAAMRQKEGAVFATMPGQTKQIVRESLWREQGGLCCYCMSKLDMHHCVIEHWLPQSRFPDKTLDYDNILLSCEGGRNRRSPGKTGKTLHCDTRKAAALLVYNPAKHDIEKNFVYMGDGTVRYAGNDQFDGQLDELLNLNEVFLRRQREAVADAVIQGIYMLAGTPEQKQELLRLRALWLSPAENGLLRPYCMTAVYFIDRRLEALA